MKLSPTEERLLAMVDGELDFEELAFISGLEPAQVESALSELVEHGLVAYSRGETSPLEGQDEAAGLEGRTELSAELSAGIDALIPKLGRLNHYQLLGVPRSANKTAIKKAYYRAAPHFHPDKHFGKRLGVYKVRIEVIFTELTKAYDTLLHSKRRLAYDARLPTDAPEGELGGGVGGTGIGVQSKPAEESRPMHPSVTPASIVERDSSSQLSDDRRAATPPEVSPVRAAAGGRPVPTSEPQPVEREVTRVDPSRLRRRRRAPTPTPRGVPPSERELAARRDALRRKLTPRSNSDGFGSNPGTTPPAPAASTPGAGTGAEDDGLSPPEQLRSRFKEFGEQMRRRRLEIYLRAGNAAMKRRDYRAAVKAFEQAGQLAPGNAEVQRLLDAASRLSRSTPRRR